MGLENPLHIIIVLAVILLVFGAKRLPEMGKGLGSGLRGFKDGLANAPEAPVLSEPTVAPTVAPAVAPMTAPAVAEREVVS